jgi:hypothetical protein
VDAIGDTCWHCHAGVGAFPLQVATKFKIPLLIWGESIAENDGRASYSDPKHKFDRDYFTKVSARFTAEEMVDENLPLKDMNPFILPSYQEIDEVGVWGIHLGDYLFWDEERQTEFIKETYGWRETEVEGAYKGYKSAECVMAGMHDFTCYLKRGFGRSTWQASQDVRNGLLSREEGFELAAKFDRQKPQVMEYFLKNTGMTETSFMKKMNSKKVDPLKDIELPVSIKNEENSEKLVPFVQQIIEKHLGKPDPRAVKKTKMTKDK